RQARRGGIVVAGYGRELRMSGAILLRFFFFGKSRILSVLLQGSLAHQRTASNGGLHGLVTLGGCELVGVASFTNGNASREPWNRTIAQRVHVETKTGASSTGAATSIAAENAKRLI